ncbi:MAG: LTA synthase family protein, partial [Gluconacetobacter diazotrophicus]|nr:LTA synthase family protein [Gluconacetobacter diazotrophicus]
PTLARVLVLGSLVGGGVLLVLGASREAGPRMVGAGLMVASLGVVKLARRGPWAVLAAEPDLAGDVRRHGLLAALSLYPLRRRGEAPLRPLAFGEADRGEEAPLVVVVQCESFADPGWMRWPAGVAAPPLPGLDAARARAHRSGRLAVSGFGAYTMRTEYGVLFGRGEAELGFRRFDPFLSVGAAERGSALPRRLPNGKQRPAVFVHPHALGFYGRDRLMPAIGFDRVIGEDGFGNAPLRGPHVADAALGDVLEGLLDRRDGEGAPRLVYAVTIENHGPWRAGRLPGSPDGLGAWFEHLRAGDALLSRLVERLERDGRRAVLCFFGDHRPSIPGAVRPGPDRDTPFVLMRFGWDGERGTGAAEERLTPAELHHAILAAAGIDAGEEGGGGG